MKFILGSIPNGAGTMVLWFLWSLICSSAGAPHVAQPGILAPALDGPNICHVYYAMCLYRQYVWAV